jgi:hypothetical protein
MMQDQAILRIISEVFPPFEADPHIIEWIECQSFHHCNHLDTKAVQISMEEANKAYIKQTNAFNEGLQDDLKAL